MNGDRRHALECAIDEAPDDAGLYAVLGDHLQELGDPRGELIALQLREATIESKRVAAAVIAQLGHPPGVQLEYARGYAKSATVDPGTAKGTRDTFAHPSGRFLRELHVAHNNAPLTGTINAIAAAPRPTLRVLTLGKQLRGGANDAERRELGDLSDLWRAVPNLEQLVMIGDRATLGEIDLPRLASLTWITSKLNREAALALVAARLPGLEELDLDCATDTAYAGGVEDQSLTRALARLLGRSDLPSLRALRLHHVRGGDALIAAIATSPLLPQLRELELIHSDLTDAGGELVLGEPARFAHLETFTLQFGLLERTIDPLHAAFEHGAFSPQGNGTDDEYYDDADE